MSSSGRFSYLVPGMIWFRLFDVGLMVLAVVVFEGLGGDVRAQSVFGEMAAEGSWIITALLLSVTPVLSASLGPDATLRPELFRSPCQRMRLLLWSRDPISSAIVSNGRASCDPHLGVQKTVIEWPHNAPSLTSGDGSCPAFECVAA